MPNVADAIKEKMAELTVKLEDSLQADLIGIFGPILGGLEYRVRAAIECLPTRRSKAAVVLQTGGGSIEVTERILDLLGKPRSLIQPVRDRPGHDRRYSIDCRKLHALPTHLHLYENRQHGHIDASR